MTLDCRCMGRESLKGLLLPILLLFFPLQGYPLLFIFSFFGKQRMNRIELRIWQWKEDKSVVYKGAVANNSAISIECGPFGGR